MRIVNINLNEIHFETKKYDQSLKESIYKRGLAFPIKVRLEDDSYYCEDGHKRLTILHELSLLDPHHRFVLKIPVILVNTSNNRSNDCWRARNHH